jgi:hypothetical protein
VTELQPPGGESAPGAGALSYAAEARAREHTAWAIEFRDLSEIRDRTKEAVRGTLVGVELRSVLCSLLAELA